MDVVIVTVLTYKMSRQRNISDRCQSVLLPELYKEGTSTPTSRKKASKAEGHSQDQGHSFFLFEWT